MRELWRGLLMGLVIAAVPAGAAGVYLCFQADMAGAGIALGVAVALAELTIGLIGMKVSARRVWRAMPRVLLWLTVGWLGLTAAWAFAYAIWDLGEDPDGAFVSGMIMLLAAAALALPPTRRLLARLFRWPTVLLLAVLCFLVPFGGGFGNAGAGVGAILVLQLLILDLLQPWDRRSTPRWRREYRYPKGYGGATAP